MSTLSMKIDEGIRALRTDLGFMKKPKNDAYGFELGNLFFSDTLKKIGERECKAAWKAAQDPNSPTKFLASDDELRAKGSIGFSVSILESRKFSFLVKLAAGQHRFDLEAFIAALVEEYGLDATELQKLAEGCKPEGTPQLSKQIIETVAQMAGGK